MSLEILVNYLQQLNPDMNLDMLALETKLTEIGLTSLDIMLLVGEVENTCNVEFSAEEIQNIKTLRDVLNLIDK